MEEFIEKHLLETIVVTLMLLTLIAMIYICSQQPKVDQDCVMRHSEEIIEYRKTCMWLWLYNCTDNSYEQFNCLIKAD